MTLRISTKSWRPPAAFIAALMAMALAMPSGAVAQDDSHQFTAPVFDIDAAPDGSILVAEGATIKAIGRDGTIGEVAQAPISEPSRCAFEFVGCINGLETVGRGSLFATSGGLEGAVGAGLWHVSHGGARLVVDIAAFEIEHDPDAFEGPQWKDRQCEALTGFVGPESNPYHLEMLSGSEALIGDAAGNTLLSAKTNGKVDWVALFTPPVADGSSSLEPEDWVPLFTAPDGTECYVQPVPTSVAVGPDGAYYVGELTGVTAENIFAGQPSTNLSRVWRVEPGVRNVVCPSVNCEVVIPGLTSVIDLEFGPDGLLYVVEYDANGWFAATVLGDAAGGSISRCDVGTGSCTVVDDQLELPSAITFDKRGTLWVLENNIVAPTVRPLAP